jgi:hypothetical protein
MCVQVLGQESPHLPSLSADWVLVLPLFPALAIVEADVAAMSFAGERELGLFEVNSRIGLLSWLDAYMASLVSATFGHDLAGSLSGFAEIVVGLNGDNDGNFDVGWNTGLMFGIGDDVQLDAGVRIVFPNSQESVTPFVGVAFRH